MGRDAEGRGEEEEKGKPKSVEKKKEGGIARSAKKVEAKKNSREERQCRKNVGEKNIGVNGYLYFL